MTKSEFSARVIIAQTKVEGALSAMRAAVAALWEVHYSSVPFVDHLPTDEQGALSAADDDLVLCIEELRLDGAAEHLDLAAEQLISDAENLRNLPTI